MAQVLRPFYITNNSGVPEGIGTTNNLSASDGLSGPTSGIINNATGDGTTRDKVFRVIGATNFKAAFFPTAFSAVDVVARIRIPGNGAKFHLIARANSVDLSGSVMSFNGYEVSLEGGTHYRRLLMTRQSGTAGIGLHTESDALGERDSETQDVTYRYVRLQCNGSSIRSYAWWEGADTAAQNVSYSATDSTHTSGLVGFYVRGAGLVDIDWISIGDGADAALQSPRYHKLDAVVYQPATGGNNSVPVTGGQEYPVRSYHRGTGSLTGYVNPSTTDATASITNMAYGNTQSILTATDLDSDPAEWGKAIAGPVTPTPQ